jgi:transcriptional regulator with XRE-family HTH domain
MSSKKWTDKSFGERLRKERGDRRWTQPQLAQKLGMHPTTLAKIEKGERSVRIVEAATIADLLDVSLDSLLGRRSGLANAAADIVNSLQHAAGKAVAETAEIMATIANWFAELGDLEFEGRQDLKAAGEDAVRGLEKAQNALFAITQLPAPRFAVTLNDLVERRANEKIGEMIKRMEQTLEQEGRGNESKP